MKRAIVITVMAFVAGIIITVATGAIAIRQNPTKALALVGVKNSPDQPQAAIPLEEQHQSALSNSFGDIVTDLQAKQGSDLEFYALHDLVVVNQNTIALLNKISADATRPELKQFAEQKKVEREKEVDQLFIWQKAWGHSHH